MPEVALRVSYRYPKALPRKRFKWDVYKCYWTNDDYIKVQISEYSIQAIMDAMNKFQKPEGPDAMKIEIHFDINGFSVSLRRDIDIDLCTTIFHDGRSIQYRSSYIGPDSNRKILESLLKEVGYHDLLTPDNYL